MATFLELAQNTRLLVGMQGTGPTSVTGNTGVEEVLVRFVRDAYIDIQNLREDWKWLERSQSFFTTAGKDTYTPIEIFLTASPNFKKYQKDSIVITDSNGKKTYLKYVDRNVLEARYLNDTNQKLPTQYTIDPSTNSLIIKPIPDGVYTVSFRYQRTPEILSANADIPSLPLSFHNLIAYEATKKMAIYLNSQSTYAEYDYKSAQMQGQLMRMELPKKRMSARPLV